MCSVRRRPVRKVYFFIFGCSIACVEDASIAIHLELSSGSLSGMLASLE
jgi:hypothetical protein